MAQVERARRNQRIFWVLAVLLFIVCASGMLAFLRISNSLHKRQIEGEQLFLQFERQQNQLTAILEKSEEAAARLNKLTEQYDRLVMAHNIKYAAMLQQVDSLRTKAHVTMADIDKLREDAEALRKEQSGAIPTAKPVPN